jgi:preprotein translocase subunit SecF
MLEKHQIIILAITIVLALLIGVPTIIEVTGYNSGIDISGTVNDSIEELKTPESAAKIKLETENKTSTYYYSTENDKKMELTETDTTTIYKVQESNRVKYTEYNTDGTVSVNEANKHLSIATPEETIHYRQPINRISELIVENSENAFGSQYNVGSVDLEEENSDTTTYKAPNPKSDKFMIIVVSNNRVQKLETDSMTVTLDYDAEEIEKPEPPEPDTDGEEEKDCSEIENCVPN